MATDDDLGLDDNDDVTASVPQKKGGMGGLLPTLLKWIAIIVGAIILIVTVVVITMNIMNKNGSGATAVLPVSSEYSKKRENIAWYTSLGQIQAQTDDTPPATYIVDIALGYKEDDKNASSEITKRQIQIKEFLRRYFSAKSIKELGIEYEDKMKIEIRNGINDDILADSIILDVIFQNPQRIE